MDVAPSRPGDTRRCDLLVVGAGPAGVAAAIDAARAGYDTLVVDKARFPRDKCCGDGLTAGALRQLADLGLDPAAVPSWQRVDDVWVRGPGGRSHRFPLPAQGTFAAVCRRSELDNALVERARDEGVTVLEEHELVSISQSTTSVVSQAAATRFESPYLVAADGMWSPTRKLLGLAPPGYRGEWHAFRQYFCQVTGPAATELLVWFEPDLLPGYAWSFPLAGGVANVGFGIQRGRGPAVGDMAAVWAELLERRHVRDALGPAARPEGTHRSWPIPARLGRAPLSEGRVLFVGDAAAATDPMTGEGIGQAIETGRDAVAAIVAAGPDRPETASSRYRAGLDRGMARDHALARALSRVLAHRRPATWALAVAGATGWTRRNFARWLFEDYPRAVIATPRRWRRGALHGPGTFDGR
jgi:geranylgeranyl reductase family protein